MSEEQIVNILNKNWQDHAKEHDHSQFVENLFH